MLRRLFAGLAITSLALLVLCSRPVAIYSQSVPSTFATGTLSALNSNVQAQLAGQSSCRLNLTGASGWVGTIQVQLQSLGDSAWIQQTFYTDANVPVTSSTASSGSWTVYPRSGGLLQVISTAWSNGLVTANINCTPSGAPPPLTDANGNTSVTFPSAQSVNVQGTVPISGAPTPIATLPSEQSTASPQPQASSLPVIGQLYYLNGANWNPVSSPSPLPVGCVGVYPCGFPTPPPFPATQNISFNSITQPVSSPTSNPVPTPSTGAAEATQGVEVNANVACLFPLGASPTITAGNRAPCQADSRGNLMVNLNAQGLSPLAVTTTAPGPTATASPPATGYMTNGGVPVIAQLGCTVNGGTASTTAGQLSPIACGNGIGSGSNAAPLAVTTCAQGSGNIAVLCPAMPTMGDAIANANQLGRAGYNLIFNGTTWDRVRSIPGSTGIINDGRIALTNTAASATVSTCTSVKTAQTDLVQVTYASSAAQTGTLTIYNEGASPTCAAADAIYVSVARGLGAATPDVVNFLASAGIAYKWTTAAEVQNVFIGTIP